MEDPDLVAWQYYRELFRWHQIYHFLEVHRGILKDRIAKELIEEASRAFGIPVEDLRMSLRLDEDFHPKLRRMFPVKELALEETESYFDLDKETVRNILSAY